LIFEKNFSKTAQRTSGRLDAVKQIRKHGVRAENAATKIAK